MARGGYRKPANPAPVSGPGKLSRRTDGAQPVMDMTGGKYGESKALREMQSAAPMAQEIPTEMSTPMQMPQVTGLLAPTERPAEPVTAGMPFGPGINSVPNATLPNTTSLRNTFERILAIDSDPDVEAVYNYLMGRGVI
jgi:hypothetical protein